jgi:hypothetical protein
MKYKKKELITILGYIIKGDLYGGFVEEGEEEEKK